MSAPHRRGACPGLSTPMATGDGLLVRLVTKERIALETLIALCAAARRHGNGIVEITARGNLQVRGLSPQSAPLFAAAVASLDVTETSPVPVITGPLPDEPGALIDPSSLASALRRAIEQAGFVLAPKVSVTIDGGGRLHLDALAADLRLRAFGSVPAPRLHLSLGGDAQSATPVTAVAPEAVVDVVLRLLSVIAARGRNARAAEILRGEGIAPFRSAIDGVIETAPDLPRRHAAEAIGLHRTRDGGAVLGVGLAFGQADADALAQLARLAAGHGASSARPAAGRALLLRDLTEDGAAALARAAEPLGLVVRADDPRRRIAACPGKPACAWGWMAARSLAAEIAQDLPPRHGDVDVHISGCAKGCAHPAPAALTVVGSERGCGIVRHATARATPRQYLEPAALVAEIRRAVQASEAGHG
jgi:precorrin-3B synthase